jgi:hypothetical protein
VHSTYCWHSLNTLELLSMDGLRSTLGVSDNFPDLSGACHGSDISPAAVYSTYCWHSLNTLELLSMDGLRSTLGVSDTTSPTYQGQVTAATSRHPQCTARIAGTAWYSFCRGGGAKETERGS